jgi:hypothetical protein
MTSNKGVAICGQSYAMLLRTKSQNFSVLTEGKAVAPIAPERVHCIQPPLVDHSRL